jgi:hypothetical protein
VTFCTAYKMNGQSADFVVNVSTPGASVAHGVEFAVAPPDASRVPGAREFAVVPPDGSGVPGAREFAVVPPDGSRVSGAKEFAVVPPDGSRVPGAREFAVEPPDGSRVPGTREFAVEPPDGSRVAYYFTSVNLANACTGCTAMQARLSNMNTGRFFTVQFKYSPIANNQHEFVKKMGKNTANRCVYEESSVHTNDYILQHIYLRSRNVKV